MHEDYIITLKNEYFYPLQHGFQSGHSAFMSLLNMQEKISHTIDHNKFSLGISFDLAKAFHTIKQFILLRKKLENYGIRENFTSLV